ncbi:hypothetical protein E1292_49840 [Nonomuraea deserti]|uniref:Uncharacterized protein n=1 Tax=Nonomuraea deserti TaxID=1848322 RepID=A0A4R4U4R3_9ACTN|nr:hypothetical protein [Nonomuraea deserti]TDC83554.1 hypothetical protein E1292_49840 [Nonomuraea deserti]
MRSPYQDRSVGGKETRSADSTGRRNTSIVEEDVVAQGRARVAILAGRPPLRSPGRPSVNRREERQRFWRFIAEGLSSEEAAVACGVSMPLGPRWFREGGGMPPISLNPPSGRYLSFAEREEIAVLNRPGFDGDLSG